MAMNDDTDIGGTGYSLDDLSDYLDRGREPAIPEIDESAECQAMLASLHRVGSLSQQLIARDAAALPDADESWIASLLTTIGREVRAGRDIPLASSDPSTSLVITEGAIRELIRAAGDSVDGVLVGTCVIEGDIAEPGSHVTVAVTISVVLSAPVRELAQAVRERVHSELLAHTELAVDEIDVTVTDVHQLTGPIEESDR
jgi:hypothetical protein